MYRFRDFCDLNEEEKRFVWEWRNDDNVRKWMYNQGVIPWESHLQFIQGLAHRSDRKYWLVEKENIPIGVIDLVDNEGGHAEFGYYANPNAKGIGFGLLKAGLLFVFQHNVIQSIYLSVSSQNRIAIALDIFLGFQFDGIKKDGDTEFLECHRYTIDDINRCRHCQLSDYAAFIKKLKEEHYFTKQFNNMMNLQEFVQEIAQQINPQLVNANKKKGGG